MRVVVGLLVLLGLLFVGTDRAAAWFVGNSVESAVTLGGSDVQGARVDIHGFPFVTQLLRRDLNHVTLSLDSGAFGSYEFHNLTIDLHGLTPHPPWQAQQVEADTVVSYATVGQLLSQQLDREVDVAVAEEPGAVRASTEFVVLGAAVPVEVVFVPAIDAPRTVTADIRTVSLAGMEMDVSALPGPIA
ncbi:MAG: DUF2993 domain-containing protein, partial [Cellulomonadaceae bacterium]|nr:DUF2993 domain-containing protein [Cellulomonadaceae bacterium]